MIHSYRLLKWVFVCVALVLVVGTTGYMYLEHVPPFEAFYMTVITITTVGYGEIIPLHGASRAFTLLLILAGVGVIMFAVGVLTQVAVEGSLYRVMEKRRVERQVEKLKNHFVICGCGRIGRYVLDELRAMKMPVVVIEDKPELAHGLLDEGVLCLLGSATEEEMLEQANLRQAKGLVVTISTDAEAVFVILTARDINPDLFIVARAAEEKNEIKLRRSGANRVMSPYRLIGKRLANSIVRPAVIDMIDSLMFSEGLDLALEGVEIYSSSPVVGQTLMESKIREKFGLIIIGIRKAHGNILFNPRADEVIEPGDTLISIGEKDAQQRLDDYLTGRRR